MKTKAFLFIFMFVCCAMQTIAQDAQNKVVEFDVNGVKFNMVEVPGGKFRMTENYIVTLDTFFIGQTEVTQELWKAVMKKEPSESQGHPKQPVENVTWNNCQKFIKKLNELTGKNFRLPTEAEWVYAAIGGKSSKGYAYSGGDKLDDVAWYQYNVEAYVNFIEKKGNVNQIKGKITRSQPHDVAMKQPNELGLYDMTGNVYEWCQDWYRDSLPSGQQTNPTGPASGTIKVFRGGSWNSTVETCSMAYRGYGMPTFGYNDLGLRLVLVP